MAQLVLGIGTSHTPMLNAPPEDWPRFYERDSKRTNLLDTEGRLTSYEEQLKHAPPGITDQITPERMRNVPVVSSWTPSNRMRTGPTNE